MATLPANFNELPKEVLNLFRRERELAEIVYHGGPATAKDVQARLRDPLSNAATRSMLNRLVRKGVLDRDRGLECVEYTYRPAIDRTKSRERALRQLAEDFFGGSLAEAAAAIANFARKAASPLG